MNIGPYRPVMLTPLDEQLELEHVVSAQVTVTPDDGAGVGVALATVLWGDDSPTGSGGLEVVGRFIVSVVGVPSRN